MKTGEIWEHKKHLLVVRLLSKTLSENYYTKTKLECWKVEVLESEYRYESCDFGNGLNIVPFTSLIHCFKKRYNENRR